MLPSQIPNHLPLVVHTVIAVAPGWDVYNDWQNMKMSGDGLEDVKPPTTKMNRRE